MIDHPAVLAEAGLAVEEEALRHLAEERLAEEEVAVVAVEAVPAVRVVGADHVVADPHLGDRGADGLHDPGAFVPQHGGQGKPLGALQDLEIGVAEPARRVADEHVGGPERRGLDGFDGRGGPDLVHDDGLESHRGLHRDEGSIG